MSNNTMTADDFETIKQSPRSASVIDVENLCDMYTSQAAKIAELESQLVIKGYELDHAHAEVAHLKERMEASIDEQTRRTRR